jgi:phosphotransferase system  glucose/maltose/N-acetylglucosamine-specific IIC component
MLIALGTAIGLAFGMGITLKKNNRFDEFDDTLGVLVTAFLSGIAWPLTWIFLILFCSMKFAQKITKIKK